jgi:hypothetical protein
MVLDIVALLLLLQRLPENVLPVIYNTERAGRRQMTGGGCCPCC